MPQQSKTFGEQDPTLRTGVAGTKPALKIGGNIKKPQGKPVESKPPVKEEPKKLLTTKNVVLGVAVLAIGYFVYKKYIKKGKL
jgi:hypothetical protein